MDAVERGLSAVNEFVREFMADRAGQMRIFTYGPEGGEPGIVSYDVGVHEIDGADAAEWVADGASVVISLKRRRRADPALGGSAVAARGNDSTGLTAQVTPPALEPEPATPEGVIAPAVPYRSAHGVVPQMPRAPGIEE